MQRWVGSLVALVLASACGEEKVVRSLCRVDADCGGGLLCEEFRCVEASTKSCSVVIDGNPILQPTPHSAAFGDLDVAGTTLKVNLHNIGNCSLTLYEVSLSGVKDTPFDCRFCKGKFPIEIFPGRAREVEIDFHAQAVGPFSDALKILSDDKQFPEMVVPLHANFLGLPNLKVTPSPIDFGYVAAGRANERNVQVTNQGTGVAPLQILSVAIVPDSQDFEILPREGVVADLPRVLKPVANDQGSILPLVVQYHPRNPGKHEAELVVVSNKGEIRTRVSGSSETPPKLGLGVTAIDFGKVPLGATNFEQLTITNEGGAPLVVKYSWGGTNPSTDFFATPLAIPPIEPGRFVEIQVAFTATAPRPVSSVLVFTSNDPARPSAAVPVTGEGMPPAGPAVVKLEMVFDNGQDNFFDKDLRNVDMGLEHPFGFVCDKTRPRPTDWGKFGNPSWISFGPKEEPERIILTDAAEDGAYRVMLQYQEDCKALPTEVLAGLLGISIDLLGDILSGGAVPIPGKDLGELIGKICFSKGGSNVTVRATVNGAILHERTVSLGKKGDSVYAFDLVRTNGVFTAK
jgi:hypothetical protein